MLALGLRQFAFSERKSHLANELTTIFRQILAAGESHFLVDGTRWNRSNSYVFGTIGKLFESVREWCLFHADICKSFKSGNYISLSDFGHILSYLQ